MIIEQELREQILLALSGQVSLNDLYAWLMDRSWNMHKDSNPKAIELAAEVEALFFERSDGVISDADLRVRLSSLVSNILLEINDAPFIIRRRTAISLPSWVTLLPSPAVALRNIRNVAFKAASNATPATELPLTA